MANPRAVAGTALAALSLAVASIGAWEGKRNEPYRDPVGILTVCYGETHAEMRRYSDAECTAMLRGRAAETMEGVRRRNPAIAGYPRQWAAHTSFAYNVGLGPTNLKACADKKSRRGYNCSGVAQLFAQGQQSAACRFMGRYVYASGQKLPGLVRRRAAEAKLCLEDARG